MFYRISDTEGQVLVRYDVDLSRLIKKKNTPRRHEVF